MATFRIFKYKHPKTLEIYSDFRDVRDKNSPFLAPDGTFCEIYGENTVKNYKSGIVDLDGEVFQKYPQYCREMNPRKVKYKDGHSEFYDPTKHC
jgi:hypothetical protein